MSEILLFRITEMNWDEIDVESDILVSQVWNVYEDGTIKSYAKYSASGVSEVKTAQITHTGLYMLRRLLKIFEKSTDDFSGCDGTGYEMILYDSQGHIQHKFMGYIYENYFLKKLKKLVCDNAHLEFPEFGDMSP